VQQDFPIPPKKANELLVKVICATAAGAGNRVITEGVDIIYLL
jgi:hypothetical protein